MPPKIGKKIVADLSKRSERALATAKEIMRKENIEYPMLQEALEYYLKCWDDFTHTGFVSIACEAVQGETEQIVSAQASIAMMAAAFDIHDDLIDKSKIKKEIPTVYGKFGAEMTLLLGNAFLIEGFKLFADQTISLTRQKEKVAFETLKQRLFEVGNAHAMEIGFKSEGKISPEIYMKITEMKAASIEADMFIGALFGGGNKAEIDILARIGRILGILATLRDDIVDVFDISELSERIAVDDLPVPLLLAIEDQEIKGEIIRITGKQKMTRKDIDKLVDLTLAAPSVKRIRKKMQLLIVEGMSLSKKLPTTKLQENLQALLKFMLEDI
jgi:geranylgeranyl pyrophosphate synthase